MQDLVDRAREPSSIDKALKSFVAAKLPPRARVVAAHPPERVLGGKTSPPLSIYQLPTGVWIARPSPVPHMSVREADEQVMLFNWLRAPKQLARMMAHSVPNSGPESKQRSALMKREGLSPGAPDLLVYSKPFGVLALEMKRESGSLGDVDPLQWVWLDYMAALPGVTACVAFGKQAAESFIEQLYAGEIHADSASTS